MKVVKLKEEYDFAELEKFGFKEDQWLYGKDTDIMNNFEIWIYKETRELVIAGSFHKSIYTVTALFELFESGMFEVVDED